MRQPPHRTLNNSTQGPFSASRPWQGFVADLQLWRALTAGHTGYDELNVKNLQNGLLSAKNTKKGKRRKDI
jgi:hypothetical protein